ncbi:hypothetical protein [Streptosporangium sp. NPDC000396]|uniref:hypothetical protein n=1 Tax=Streptosporangium sp. NPDC000396 TaxID=3366185 RepID=UPI0036812E92
MIIDELVKRTLHNWSDEARVPADLASKALGRRRRSRIRTFAVVAGATAAVVAGAFTVPAVIQGTGQLAVLTDPSLSTKTVGDPASGPPKSLVAAGRTAVYAYYTWDQEKISDKRQVRKRTWYLYDKGEQTYRQTPWAWLDVAPAGEYVAVLERILARRVGVVAARGGGVRWIDLEHPAAAVRWSPDGRRLLVTNYGGNPDEFFVPVNGRQPVPSTRTGYTIVDLGSGQAVFHPLKPNGDNWFSSRLDLSWSADGTLVWEPVPRTRAGTKRFYDLSGKPRSAPPGVAETYLEAGVSPGGRWLVTDSPVNTAFSGVKDMRTGKTRPIQMVEGYWIYAPVAWADDDHMIAWGCGPTGTGCDGTARNRLVLIDVDGKKAVPLTGYRTVPLTGYRQDSRKPGQWEPIFSRR